MTEHINMHEIINDNIVYRLYGLNCEDLKLRTYLVALVLREFESSDYWISLETGKGSPNYVLSLRPRSFGVVSGQQK